jgi:hypothetical protein
VAEPVQVPPEHVREPRPRSRRTELERLIDLTVLGSTHPELGTCWLFTGTTTPYGRIAKAQDSYTHRLGWKLLRGPIPEGRERTISVASMPAGILTICSWSLTPRIWRTAARRTASVDTRCRGQPTDRPKDWSADLP